MSDLPPAWRTWFGKQKHRLLALATLASLAGYSTQSRAEPASCLSPNPADWPPPARPLFLIAVDTSGSMVRCTNQAFVSPAGLGTCTAGAPLNSCGLEPTRINDAKCALRKMVQSFGEVDFALMSFPFQANCSGAPAACGPYGNVDGAGTSEQTGPGNRCTLTTNGTNLLCPAVVGTGGKILAGLPLLEQSAQIAKIVSYTDDVCQTGDPVELLPTGPTPLNGLLKDAGQHLKNNIPLLAPSCRPLNIILLTDGNETCDGNAADNNAKGTANLLYTNGLENGDGRHIRVFPIGFGGLDALGKQALEDIADAGQCGTGGDANCKASAKALFANNEAELSISLSQIITGSIAPETCDNVDNNCNGCTDEGFNHYCNKGRTPVGTPTQDGFCCSWNNESTRKTCIEQHKQSISAQKPEGDLFLLPCWDPVADAGKLAPEKAWLCTNPREICDEIDNNCDATTDVNQLATNQVDENFNKCGSPVLKCPAPQDTCVPGSTQGVDDDCDGVVDNLPGSSVPGSACGGCVASSEVCDNKDNDCDGNIDNGVPEIPCGPPAGPSTPPNCQGTLKCVNGVYSSVCTLSPQPELCDGLDNDCDGKVDNGAPGTTCEVPGKPGLIYQDDQPAGQKTSQCKKGTVPCNGAASACSGYVGPSQEICDGIDNDCDGEVDEDPDGPGPGKLPGVGVACGSNKGECKPGTRACVGGVFVCTGGVQPQPELCNGKDDDCDGVTDAEETVFADAPPPDQSGCWSGLDLASCPAADVCPNPVAGSPGWCKPAGATCNDVGTLSAPCTAGTLSCKNTLTGFAYICDGGLVPSPEKCDGADNDCNSQIDDGLNVNPKPCQTACGQGTETCKDGQITCSAPTPKPEECNNIDDNCNGAVDENVTQPCNTECGSGVQICKNGVFGPCSAPEKKAEVCDGVDNDCDGLIDENAELDGTADPNDPTKVIGQPCGKDEGECKKGNWGCLAGVVTCIGGVGPQPEKCDCLDNDCDGKVDEAPEPGEKVDPVCGTSTTQICVNYNGYCQCAEPCQPLMGEFGERCPSGNFTCTAAPESSTGKAGSEVCVKPSDCNNCEAQTVKQTGADGKEQTLCAPSSEPGKTPVPKCECKAGKCGPPCSGVKCDAPLVCTDFGAEAGTCVDNSCYTVPCSDGKICNDKAQCVDNPCKTSTCKPDEACKPTADLKGTTCVKTCANGCAAGEACVNGTCTKSECVPGATGAAGSGGAAASNGCPDGKTCNTATQKCEPDTCKGCQAGQVCNPATKKCEAGPCEGVICPAGQFCEAGGCEKAPGAGGAGGAGGSGTGGSSTGGNSTGGSSTGGNSTGGSGNAPSAGGTSQNGNNGPVVDKAIGVTTGGGGCACQTGVGTSGQASATLALLAALVPALRRRARARAEKGGAQ